MIDSIKKLIRKSQSIKQSKKINHKKISKFLGVNFSQGFKEICNQIGFDYFGPFEWFNTEQTEQYSIIGETKNLRSELNLEKNILFLASDGTSLLFMKCLGDHEEIYWIAIEDVERFCKGEPLEGKYEFFSSFSDFFQFLLDWEEKNKSEAKS